MTTAYTSNHWILAALSLAVGIFFFSCKGDIKAIQEIGEDDTAPFQTIHEGQYTFTDSGRVRNTLQAGTLAQYIHDTDYVSVSNGLVLNIYNPSQQLVGTLASERGYYFKKQNRMEAWDNVVFTNAEGDSLLTEQLTWQSDSNLISTTQNVKIIRDGTEILGKGLRSNESFTRYRILAPIGDITVPEELDSNESEGSQ